MKVTLFKCDVVGCKEETSADPDDSFTKGGWRFLNGKDVCPKHVARYMDLMDSCDTARETITAMFLKGEL